MVFDYQSYLSERDSQPRFIAGCMTGTSMDGLDVALVRIEGHSLEMKAIFEKGHSVPLGALTEPLSRLARTEPLAAGEITRMSNELSLLHLKALKELLQHKRIDLVAVHGQTVYHAPPLSWQLINPTPIAYGLEVPVVFDLRSADLTRGGQGAPITPLADFILFRGGGERRCIANLGGFCNITQIPASSGVAPEMNQLLGWTSRVYGKDVCACNHLLDRIARELFQVAFDHDGNFAMQGKVLTEPLESLFNHLKIQALEKRSLGTGDESFGWIEEYRGRSAPQDLMRTACAAIAKVICLPGPVDRRILAGGGVKNAALVLEITERSKCPVETSDKYGIPPNYREAAAMAILGALCQDRTPITLTQVTGVLPAPVAGCWVFPGRTWVIP